MKEKIANIQNSSQARGTWGNQAHNDNNQTVEQSSLFKQSFEDELSDDVNRANELSEMDQIDDSNLDAMPNQEIVKKINQMRR